MELCNDKYIMRLPGGFVFDYSTMMKKGRIEPTDLIEISDRAYKAAEAVEVMRKTGFVKSHLSKDGEPEKVYFTRLPYAKAGNPNDEESVAKLKELAEYVHASVDAVLFLGVGGSYLGNKVLFDLFCSEAWNVYSKEERRGWPYILFGGNNVDPRQTASILHQISTLMDVKDNIKGNKFRLLLVPISKSGTTLETLTAFSYFYEHCSENPDLDLDVAVVTDLREEVNSPLLQLAQENSWRAFDVKDGVGGRFSVLHNPGLVTAAAIGMDIDKLLAGAASVDEVCRSGALEKNPALANACLKYLAAEKYGADLEVLMGYGMSLKSVGEWYVQLLAESLGKRLDREGNIVFYGRTPIAAVGSTDMHAQTQQHQDGKRNKVVQFLSVEDFERPVELGNPFPHIPAFAKYHRLSLSDALKLAMDANREALDSDGRFSAVYTLPKLDEYRVGQLLFFLMLSVTYEGELADVDAFDQPGVEAYKKIMRRELSK